MKKIVSVILTFVMMLSMITMVGAADFSGGESLNVYTTKGAEGLSYEAAVAYKGVINDMHKEYGDYQGYDDSWEMAETGLGLAMLIDFDHNGTLELLIGCGTINPDEDRLFYEVYGYENGLVKYTHQYCCGSMDLCFDLHFGDNGKNVYTITPAGSNTVCDGSSFYGTLLNGKWEVTEYYSHEAGFCDGEWCGLAGKDVYRINGIDVSYEKWVDRACDIEEEYGPESYDDVERDYYTFGKKGIVNAVQMIDNIINSRDVISESDSLDIQYCTYGEYSFETYDVFSNGYDDIRSRVICIKNGDVIWTFDTPKGYCLRDAGGVSPVYLYDNETILFSTPDTIYCLNINTGELNWFSEDLECVWVDNLMHDWKEDILIDKAGNIYVPSLYDGKRQVLVINNQGLIVDKIQHDGYIYDLMLLEDKLLRVIGSTETLEIDISKYRIKVDIDGKKVSFDQPPIIVDGRTLVPLRAIFEGLGATVHWDGNTQTVTSTKGQTTISMSIGKTEMYKNGKSITLDVVPQLVGDRTLVPVRAVAEAFDCKVDWDGETRTVIIKQ